MYYYTVRESCCKLDLVVKLGPIAMQALLAGTLVQEQASAREGKRAVGALDIKAPNKAIIFFNSFSCLHFLRERSFWSTKTVVFASDRLSFIYLFSLR